jgi:hypothetical protein
MRFQYTEIDVQIKRITKNDTKSRKFRTIYIEGNRKIKIIFTFCVNCNVFTNFSLLYTIGSGTRPELPEPHQNDPAPQHCLQLCFTIGGLFSGKICLNAHCTNCTVQYSVQLTNKLLVSVMMLIKFRNVLRELMFLTSRLLIKLTDYLASTNSYNIIDLHFIYN